MKYTPGNWKAVAQSNEVITIKVDHIEICRINPNIEESVANAQLIAAAPELLDALERMLLWANIGDESPSRILRDEVKSLISKAK